MEEPRLNSTRIGADDTSRVSLAIGFSIGAALIAGVTYLVILAYGIAKEVSSYDPNRPVPADSVLRKRLKPEQYHVTRENGTETAFHNDHWDEVNAGLYVDVITGDPLFCSQDKFDAANGRPNFSKPIAAERIVQKKDLSHEMERIEVRAARSDAHLGHLFDDGPPPSRQRYVVNSAALRFIPVERLQKEGYGDYVTQFEKKP